jgi:hypothetical protein
MVTYKVLDRVIYNPTNSSDKVNFQYGTIIEIDDIYLFIRFDNNEKIFKLLSTDVCLDHQHELCNSLKKIVITI